MYIDSDFVSRFVENIALLIGENCEIVVHDFTNGYDRTIVKIINGHISGRSVGECPTNLLFEEFGSKGMVENDFPIYFNQTEKGRIIKSSTTFVRNKKKKVVGAVCVNLDITELVHTQKMLHKFLGYDPNQTGKAEIYAHSLSEIMEHYLQTVENEIGKPASEMNKDEKLRALAFLDQKGVLQMAKASIRLCDFFNISKFTLYNYLDEVRTKVNGNEQDP